MSGEPRFLVTGSNGCIGAWIVRELLERGQPVTTFSRSSEPRRLRLLVGAAAADAVPHVAGDVTELAALEAAIDEHDVTNVIHLAAALIPECQADPANGARVNVIGTLNVFEAAKRRLERMGPVVYASSVAVYGPDDANPDPNTHYGIFKRANEDGAGLYFRNHGLSSVGLRPFLVYGVGRDQGLTAVLTQAMLAAAAGTPCAIPFGGRFQLEFAGDVARAFVDASLGAPAGASAHNIPGPSVTVPELVEAISRVVPESVGSIVLEDVRMPFAEEVDTSSFAAVVPDFRVTSLDDGVRQTVASFRALLASGQVSALA